MTEFITGVYLFYSFIAFYMLFLFGLIYFKNKNKIYKYPELTKNYSLSIIIPCYNEEKNIGGTIKALLDSDYKGLKKIIVVDDCSTDNSYKIMKQYAKKYDRVMAVQTPKNTGKASGAKNYGAKFADTELIGFVDADSYPEKSAIRKMIGFFDDEKIGAVTSAVLAKNRKKIIENLQSIEYKIIVFTRKLLNFVDGIYVTPGPLAIYRKKVFENAKGFDETNMTEDIEITWNFVSKGYKIAMSVSSKVYTVVPSKIKDWYRQRIRWNLGGIQTMNKYKKSFLRTGMLGVFILPFFVLSWILGLFGLGIIIYRGARRILINYFSTSYSIEAQTALLSLRDLNLTPNVLVFFGVAIFILSLGFTFIALFYTREKGVKQHGLLSILVYSVFYLLAYPFLLIISMYKFIKGESNW